MNEYPHIDSVYKRDDRGNFIIGEYSKPEFEYLKDLPWVWTEKVDGTNVRVMWDGANVTYGGKTDKAQLPTKLVNWLNHHFGLDDPDALMGESFGTIFGPEGGICLYGEGYGAGIQKGGGNYSLEQQFVLFDVRVGHWWLKRDSIEDIATKLNLQVVPIHSIMDIPMAIDFVTEGFTSAWGDFRAEGLVGQPYIPLLDRSGQRIITKVKTKDFK